MQRSHIASVYIYICIYIYIYVYIYIRHTLIARGRGRLHRCGFCGPDSHVFVRAKCKEAIYTGKRDTASEESKAKERESDRLTKKRCIQGEFSGDK